jgi:hypothetical protein
MRLHLNIKIFPFLLDLIQSALDLVLLSSNLACVIDSFSVANKVLLDEDLIKGEGLTFRIKINMIFKLGPVTRPNKRLPKEINQWEDCFEVFNGGLD